MYSYTVFLKSLYSFFFVAFFDQGNINVKSENNAHTVNAKNADNFEQVAAFLSQSNK